jgi:hypothetical protein
MDPKKEVILMKAELYKLIKIPGKRRMLLLFLILPSLEIMQFIMTYYQVEMEKSLTQLYFLSGSSRGHIIQMIVLWALPMYFVYLVGSDHGVYERTYYKYALYSRKGAKAYLRMRLLYAFLVGFLVMTSALIIDMILVTVLFISKTPISTGNTPFYEYVVYMVVASVVVGLLCLLGECAGRLFKSYRYIYPLMTILWFVLIYAHPSIMYLFQPYTEYSLTYAFPIFIVLLILTMTNVLGVVIYEKKKAYY